MKTYKYDTHVHTSEVSGCARTTGVEMAEAYKAKGYDGIIITDHFFNGNSAVPRDLPWEERIELFCKGYENSKKRGDEIGLSVFFGWEYTYWGSDFLTYGLDKQWLTEHPEIMDIHIWEYADLVHASGGFIVHAHPFRLYDYIKMLALIPNKVDAIETINASNRQEENERAKWYAESYGLPVTAGSDSHNANNLLGGGIITDTEIKTISDYADILKNGGIVKLLDKEK